MFYSTFKHFEFLIVPGIALASDLYEILTWHIDTENHILLISAGVK